MCGYPLPADHTQPRGCILVSEARKGGANIAIDINIIEMECADRPAEPVTDYPNCNFFNENFMRAYCGVEAAAHDAVRKVVTPEDVVLEVGARYPRQLQLGQLRLNPPDLAQSAVSG